MKNYSLLILTVILLHMSAKAQTSQQNPLNDSFTTAYQTPPFSQIKEEHFKPAIEAAIAEAREEIKLITDNSSEPTFENTIEPLDFSAKKLSRINAVFYHLNAAETTDNLQQIAKEISPLLSEYSSDIKLNDKLFERIKTVYHMRSELKLNPEQLMLLEKTFKSFSRNGALLSKNDKEKLRGIDKQLAALTLQFGQNVLAENNAYQLHLTKTEELAGLPDYAIQTAQKVAEQKGVEGWIFTLDFPSYQAIMKYSDIRNLREQMAKAYAKRGFQDNEYNNENIIKQIVQLRQQRSQLLDYKTYADFVLEERMAENVSTVNNFLQDLLVKAKPKAMAEFKELEEFAKIHGLDDSLQLWDGAYYSEKLKKQKFDLNDEVLKPYFQLENVLQGAFTIAGKLYGLKFEKIDNIEVYHTEVETYKVTDDKGEFVAIFYADFLPRKGKRNGAWMNALKGQWIENNNNSRPQITNVCNFTRPTDTQPSLLSFQEVRTLFHEFGHALHGMLANTTYSSLSGTSVYWDFVELPSQFMENFVFEEEALKLFAKHYQTGETIPMHLIEKIKESSSFMEGMATVRQLSFGLLDMAWHGTELPAEIDLKTFERQALLSTQIYPEITEGSTSTAFSHIFSGGYASGYYSYKWAEVLDADAFAYFQETGIFNAVTAKKFKDNVLSKGGTEKPMLLYQRFRGKSPNNDALLKRAGLQ